MKNNLLIFAVLVSLFNIHLNAYSESNQFKLVKVMKITQDGSKYISSNGGVNWTLQKSNYNDKQKILLLKKDGKYLSTNSGTAWTKIQNKQIANSWNLSIFPNPAENIITLSLKGIEPGSVTISVFNIHGEKVIEKNFIVNTDENQFSSDISFLPNGMYFVKITRNLRELFGNNFIKN